jgi:hypothetical protein
MAFFKGVIVAGLAAAGFSATSGCGGSLGIMRGMRDTKISAEHSNYSKLAEAATKLGWTSTPGTGKKESMDDWDLTVTPGVGQKIIFTRNNLSGKISFNCTGDPIDDQDECLKVTNQLLAPLGWVYP